MRDIYTYEEKLGTLDTLKRIVTQLVELTINSKKFKFETSELNFDFSILEEHQILISEETKLVISPSALYYSLFFDHYAHQFNFQLSENINEVFDFIEKIEEELKTNQPFNTNIFSFFKGFKAFVLFLVHKKFNSDFSAFIKSLNKESGRILYDFNYAYSLILPFLKTPINILYDNLNHLISGVTSDVQYNSNLYEISNAVRVYCKDNIEEAQKLLVYCLAQPSIVHNLTIPLIGGLYENQRDFFWNEIIHLLEKSEIRTSVICALSSTPALSTDEGIKYYTSISSLGNITEEELFNLSRFFTSIINNKNIVDIPLKKSCFQKLNELILNPNPKIRQVVLNDLSFIDDYDSEVVDLLKNLLSDVNFNKDHIHLVGNVFIRNKDLSGFIDLISIYGEKFKLDFKADYFSSALYNFKQESFEDLSIELIKLITHDLGYLRYIGIRIIEYLTPHNGRFIFQTDLLKFDALTQYKLWISVLSEVKEPKYTLPMLFPLLRTQYSFVKEAFIGKTEQLTEEYGNSVFETIEAELDLSDLENLTYYERVKVYCEEFWAEVSKKRGIKELDPVYTQSELYNLYSENYGKSFNKNLSEGVEKKSVFMQFATTVVLAKGGGWKHEKHGKVEKLGKVSTSFQLPRSYFVSPEAFDWNFRTNYLESWNNKFKKWEAIISS